MRRACDFNAYNLHCVNPTDEIGWTRGTQGCMRNAYKILLGKHDAKIPFRRPRHRLDDKIKLI
jgi:hypothetical protein